MIVYLLGSILTRFRPISIPLPSLSNTLEDHQNLQVHSGESLFRGGCNFGTPTWQQPLEMQERRSMNAAIKDFVIGGALSFKSRSRLYAYINPAKNLAMLIAGARRGVFLLPNAGRICNFN